MAMPSDTQRQFRLYVTHVDGEGYFLKISGQLDQQASLMVESLFETSRENLEKGVGAVPAAAIREGIICAAKYKDGTYYRAKVINTTRLSTGLVGVHFIDYGNKDIISLSTIRFLESYDPMFLQLRGQATDYYLLGVMHPSGKWEEPLLLKLVSMLCYAEYPATIEAQTHTLPIISVQFKGTDLSSYLIQNRFGVGLPVAKQEALLHQFSNDSQQASNWQPSFINESPSYPEHVPFLINHNFPSNPASAMRLQNSISLPPFNGTIPPPTLVSQRLANKVPRNPLNLKATRQPQSVTMIPVAPSTTVSSNVSSKSTSPKKSTTYKSRLLEANSQHKVLVSYAEEGPELFAVQLVVDAKKLQDMMDDINKRPHSSLTEPPMIGTVCLGRMFGDRIICRAIVMNLSGSQCKLFFVDFGDTEMVSYYDIFDIPEEFVKPNVFALRFCLSGVKKLEKGPHLNETFKQLVNGKVLTLRVVAPEGPPLIQYGELYLDNKNILDLLMANMKDKLQFKWLDMLPLGSRCSVLVSYVDSCLKFFVQLSDKIDELNAVMDAVKLHCENSSSPGELAVGAACCARFSDDGNWYRAIVKGANGSKMVVSYVDYGNEQEVDVSDVRTITGELIRLPAQAMKCALKGYENKPVETKTSNQLEMLALEKTLMAHVVGVLSSDTMLVTLVDDTVNPPMDVARRMNQLSQPRSNHEVKTTAPIRKEPSDTFSSPEGSVDDNKKKNFRREKSFKDDRRPRDGNDEFAHRGGSFRSRENKDNFERSGPGRHSDKQGRERGDRRGGSKPWENNASGPVQAPPAAADDEWEDSPAQASFQTSAKERINKDNSRDKRKSKVDQQHDKVGQKPGWKSKESGVGKRLRQASEAASAHAQVAHKGASIQDRLKRDNKFKQDEWDENKNDIGANKGYENRPERREYRERRENRGEKRDNFQKREFRDNRGDRERGDRNRSNFTPRDRADRTDRSERSFGSDGDKRSDRSFSQDARDRSGRAPPYKDRSKFQSVQYKELSDPLSLDTPFIQPTIELGAQHEVSVTWIISPESFYTQILSLQPKFLEMMYKIPEMYKGVKCYTGPITVGSSVLARYPDDGVLYRATIVSIQPFSKFIVRYVDFGNKQLVDAKDIWQLDSQLMELPIMAVHCSLLGVAPKDGEWKADPEIDLCFNAPRYQCIFQECVDGHYKVSLWNNGVSVADMLVEKQLAAPSEHQSSATLKDEAIDLTIIVGQQIPCRVTHVESFEKFFVQLDSDKAALVEGAIESFDNQMLSNLAPESVVEGVHCTVRHENKVYRAILNDVTDHANITAVLPDYGKTITTCLENVMVLPTELSVYYYQSLECCLNNYSSESKPLMSLEELKERLTNNKFIVYINSVKNISLVTTLYDFVSGQKVAIFEPDEGAYEAVVQLCMRSVFNYNFGLAFVSHAESLNELYLQKSSDTNKIAQLLDELYKFYEEGTPETVTSFEVDGLCACKSSDGNWYRATIVNIGETEIKVQFPDYGNSETVPKDSLKKLDSKFFEPCAFAVVVGLGLVALQDDTLSKLTEWTSEKEIQVTLSFGTDGWLANLHLDGVDLSMRLVNEKLATPQIIADEESKPDLVLEEPISLPEGCTQVYISHIDTPGQFWLQMSDKVEKIDEIQAELQANADTYADIENREMGTLCIAKYSADDQWYRAEILDADSDITTVRFIDYGNTDVLDNQPGLLKIIPEHLKETDRYAIKSSVNAVPTGTGQWSEPASDYFSSLFGDFTVPVDALIVLKDVTTYVDVFINGQNLTNKLVSEGHATRSEEPECGDLPSCFASHVNSPSEFWIQLETATPELQAMESAMIDAENFPELASKEEGVLCAAKYPEDGAWYRAQVIVDGSEGTEVLFMDYGNASIATELRSLPEELQMKPALSRKCALQKPRDVKSWSRKSEIKFNELAAEGATIFNVQFIASGDISIVELYLDNKSVTEELIGLCEEQPLSERPPPIGQELQSCKVSYISSIDEFYVHLDEILNDLDKVTNGLINAAEFDIVPELKVGSVCAAIWSEDDLWYRAKILEFSDVDYLVQFIDHGNKCQCKPDDFKQLPEDLASIEPLAKCCRLVSECLSSEVKEKLISYLESNESPFQIEFLDTNTEPFLVKLFLNSEDITSLISLELKSDNDTLTTGTESTNITNDSITHVVETVVKPSQNKEITDDSITSGVSDELTNVLENTSTEILTNKETVLNEEENIQSKKSDCVEVQQVNIQMHSHESKQSQLPLDTSSVDTNIKEIEIRSELIDQNGFNNVECISNFDNDTTVAQSGLNDSEDSNNTVIENSETIKETSLQPNKFERENFEHSKDALKISESIDSINTDTGYTSGSNTDASPTKLISIKGTIENNESNSEKQSTESEALPEKLEESLENIEISVKNSVNTT